MNRHLKLDEALAVLEKSKVKSRKAIYGISWERVNELKRFFDETPEVGFFTVGAVCNEEDSYNFIYYTIDYRTY